MMSMYIVVTDPKVVTKKHESACRCVVVEVLTAHNDTVSLQFENIEDARAFHGIFGYALEVPDK